MMRERVAATVWAATWIPASSPIEGFGSDGYAVCWADLADGTRVQALVDGSAPPPGARGDVVERTFGDLAVPVFTGRAS